MSGEYIIIEDGRTIGHSCGRFKPGKDCREVPDGFAYEPGADIRNYDKAWRLRPLADRIKDGLVVVSAAEKIVGEHVVAKNRLERIRDGIDKAPGMKIVEEDGILDLVPMTTEERYKAGEITKQTAEAILALNARADRSALLSACDWTQTKDQDAKISELWKPYRQALKDITEQGGFPWDIKWPATPDGVKA